MNLLGLLYLFEKLGLNHRERCFFIFAFCGILLFIAGLLLAIDYWLL